MEGGSNVFSRVLPQTSGTQSIYRAIKQHEQLASDDGDVSDAANAVDDENIQEHFQDQDLDQLLIQETDSRITVASIVTNDPASSQPAPLDLQQSVVKGTGSLRYGQAGENANGTSNERDVPDSLLMEDRDSTRASSAQRAPDLTGSRLPAPVPGPRSKTSKVQWAAGQPQQRLYDDMPPMNSVAELQSLNGPVIADPSERAMWMWANVENLDNFLAEVYAYFRGRGIWSLLLARCFEQLTLAFVVGFGTFLMSCIDYGKLPTSKALPEIIIPKCTQKMSGFSNLLVWVVSFYWMFKSLRIVVGIRRLWSLHLFFKHLLHVSEDELQTITWQKIVDRLMRLRDLNARTALNVNPQTRKFIGENSKQRMDAHDIANRLMRRENYLIALFNKDILDLTLPVPFLRNRQLFSQNLEWNINLCVTDFVFNEQGQVSQLFLKDSHRHDLIEGLRRRFMIAGFINVICAPFFVTYFLMLFFLRYFTEFQKNPSQVGSRSFTPLAEWKFREFNELYHFFERRLNMSRPFASRYLDQFPKDKTIQLARFVAFVAGALAAVLGVASLLDPEIFFGFEITTERTVLFYLGIFGTVWAIARGMVPEDEDVFDPEFAINNVADFTHYKPKHWTGRLHTEEVRAEFSSLYQMKVVIFLEEILSIIFTPFVLWFSLPQCSERLVDFFREFTVHVDGLGYVCSFALFEFQQSRLPVGASRVAEGTNDRDDLREDYYATKDGKMLASYYSFIDSYANKPRGTSHRHQDRRAFRPPPAFPGLSSSPSRTISTRETTRHRHKKDGKSRARQELDEASSPSVLLDPLHQPVSGHGTNPQPDRMSRRSRLHHATVVEDESTTTHGEGNQTAMANSVAFDEDSSLGDSWKTTMAAGSGGPSRTPDQANGAAGNDNGVLGLLYEFQRAQTEGRGVDVKM